MHRFFLRILAISAAILTGVMLALNWAIDPHQNFRAHSYPQPNEFEERHLKLPGLVRHANYRMIVTGTSQLGGISPSYVAKSFDLPVLSATLNGSSIFEQHRILKLAIQERKTPIILWGISEFSLGHHGALDVTHPGAPETSYLYKSSVALLPYLFNTQTTRRSLRIGLTLMTGFPGYRRATITGIEPAVETLEYSADRLQRSLPKCKKAAPLTNTEGAPHANVGVSPIFLARLEKYVASLISENQQTLFYVILPPVHADAYRVAEKCTPGAGLARIKNGDAIARRIAQLPNARVYDFRAVPEIVTDASLFHDGNHFSPSATNRMIDLIRMDRYRVVPGHDFSADLVRLALR